jgi:DNA repair exonuclease SbcCD nuclease subunit
MWISKFSWTAIIVATDLALVLPSPGQASSSVRIGIIGDQTWAPDLDKSYDTLRKGVEVLNARGVDLVLHVGDLVESGQSPEQITARFGKGKAILNGLHSPWFMTAGDHDVNPLDWTANSGDRTREALFRSLYGAINPKAKDRLYYSFDAKGYHFVVLYSMEALRTDPRWGNVFYSGISDKQFAWLSANLKRHAKRSKGVVVLL